MDGNLERREEGFWLCFWGKGKGKGKGGERLMIGWLVSYMEDKKFECVCALDVVSLDEGKNLGLSGF